MQCSVWSQLRVEVCEKAHRLDSISSPAGRQVTELLQTQLRRAGHIFHTSAEKEVVRHMKEQVCYVAHNPQKEESATSVSRFDGAGESTRSAIFPRRLL